MKASEVKDGLFYWYNRDMGWSNFPSGWTVVQPYDGRVYWMADEMGCPLELMDGDFFGPIVPPCQS